MASSLARPIGIFDSGIGGLTIARAIKRELPNEQIVYFGDTKHLPYGDKSSDSIKEYSKKITEFLIGLDCKAIVIACNSASTSASLLLNKSFGKQLPILNVIDPTIDFIVSKGYTKVGLIGTKRTVSSQVYAKRLKLKAEQIELNSRATPLLAPMIEEGYYNNQISKTIIHSYLDYDRFNGIEALILGCTHYPLIIDEIKSYYDHKVDVIDSSRVIAKEVKRNLRSNQLLANKEPSGQDIFYVSEYTKSFELSAFQFFGEDVKLLESKLFNI